ncbi:ribulose-phosphate 3-epimerase [Ruminiclostridium sufflavum DSM 19573]|uniref:Ribulose-phosphate 3-epimerase n=1 Tax=Ruminiclostridium sufflavum DSM 19573 TaxID=1121337 RepID=A0A318XP39_9FIRM|nr:ribulose-phosphate 3-epimerase [Ruminiclostridium sufflavum]PYG87388.1 ribulose-phosphate 3-epimerase [Ruminiclostridium sufflavum DSM 19573]
MLKIAPSILSADFSCLGNEIKKVDSCADLIHVDVMDGHFVPNITIGPEVVKCIRKATKTPFDVHLMIQNPDQYIEKFAEAGADIITVHAETGTHLNRTIELIKGCGKKAGIALNPATSLSVLDYVLQDVDMVLIMCVNPGFGGQKYIDLSTQKIQSLKNMIIRNKLDIDIEVDGGINAENIDVVVRAGAGIIVTGSAVYNTPDPEEAVKQLRMNAYKKSI